MRAGVFKLKKNDPTERPRSIMVRKQEVDYRQLPLQEIFMKMAHTRESHVDNDDDDPEEEFQSEAWSRPNVPTELRLREWMKFCYFNGKDIFFSKFGFERERFS
jgi:hypothetical protein